VNLFEWPSGDLLDCDRIVGVASRWTENLDKTYVVQVILDTGVRIDVAAVTTGSVHGDPTPYEERCRICHDAIKASVVHQMQLWEPVSRWNGRVA
jgi:hypothetical protein